jgi:hypothetical protein
VPAGAELPALLQLIQEANSKCCQAIQKAQFVMNAPDFQALPKEKREQARYACSRF